MFPQANLLIWYGKITKPNTTKASVKILSADFAATSKTAEQNLCCLLKVDITPVTDGNENERTSR